MQAKNILAYAGGYGIIVRIKSNRIKPQRPIATGGLPRKMKGRNHET